VYWTTATWISWHLSTTLTEGFPCFFLSCKGITRKEGAWPALLNLFPFYCYVCSVLCILCNVCVLYYCYRVSTQLQFKINNNDNNNNLHPRKHIGTCLAYCITVHRQIIFRRSKRPLKYVYYSWRFVTWLCITLMHTFNVKLWLNFQRRKTNLCDLNSWTEHLVVSK
jgi:hypothetical protein